jgi:hypothetical protein
MGRGYGGAGQWGQGECVSGRGRGHGMADLLDLKPPLPRRTGLTKAHGAGAGDRAVGRGAVAVFTGARSQRGSGDAWAGHGGERLGPSIDGRPRRRWRTFQK